MNDVYKYLEKYNQTNLLNFYNEISDLEKEKLINGIKNIDFKLMKKLYVNSYIDEKLKLNKVSPLKIINKVSIEDRENYQIIGENLILNNNYGIVILAGGNASRLGLNKPKGLLEVNYFGVKKSLFEIYIDKLKEVYLKYKVYINLYIMLNSESINIVKKYFAENNYFNYPKDKMKFFVQRNLPLIGIDGKILMKDKANIWLVPNGNGNVFETLKYSNLIKDMKNNNIKYCLFTGIDNPLVNLVDYSFIGCTIFNNYKLSSKTIYKSNALDLDWVFCKYNNKPYMLDDNHLKYFNDLKDSNGEYCYREKNIIYHLIHIDYINKFANINLKYHRAYKEYQCINKEGILENIKCFKFEQFIYDAFYYAKDMLLYRTNELEFCPIKRKEDIIKIEKLLNNKK